MTSSRKISILITVFFVLIIISDFHYKIISTYGIVGTKLTLPIKLLIGVFLSCYLILKKLLDNKKLIYLSLFGLVIFVRLISQNEWHFEREIYIIGQYVFGVIVFLFFSNSYHHLDFRALEKFLYLIVLLNFVCIILALIFDLQLFKTYFSRFGYNGILKSTSTASYFYMFTVLYLLVKKDKNKQLNLLLLIALLSAFLVGSKTLYAFIAIVFIVYLLRYINQKQRYVNSTIFYLISAVILIVLGLYLFIPLISLNKTLHKVLINDSVVSAFFSYRNKHVVNAFFEVTTNYDLSNYLFGGLSKVTRLTEVAVVDVFLNFGAIGAVVFFVLFFKNMPHINNPILKTFLIVIFCLIMLRGNFFYFPSVIYLALAIFTLTLNHDRNQKHSK